MRKLKNRLGINLLLLFAFWDLLSVFSAQKAQAQSSENKENPKNSFLSKNQSVKPMTSSEFVSRQTFKNNLSSLKTVNTPLSYSLIVRGGRGLRLSTENTKTPSLVKLIIEFAFSTGKAGDGLRPAQGAWQDRGGRGGEPARLEYFAREDDAKKIIDYLQSAGAYYTFECYNTGKGYLQATKAYPKKVRID